MARHLRSDIWTPTRARKMDVNEGVDLGWVGEDVNVNVRARRGDPDPIGSRSGSGSKNVGPDGLYWVWVAGYVVVCVSGCGGLIHLSSTPKWKTAGA